MSPRFRWHQRNWFSRTRNHTYHCGSIFTCCLHGRFNWPFLLPVWGNCKYSCSYFHVYQFYTRPNAFSTLERPSKEKESRLQRFFNRISKLLDGLTHIYEKLLKLALRFRFITVIIAIASLFAALGLSKLIGTEFVPVPDKGEIRIQFETPIDSSLEYTQANYIKSIKLLGNSLMLFLPTGL